MVARRTVSTTVSCTEGNTNRLTIGSVFTGAATGGGTTTVDVATHNNNSAAQRYDLILLRIA